MRFVADENFPLTSARRLATAGHDVDRVVGTVPSVEDEEVLLRAVAEQRILLTFDSDFGALIYRDRMRCPPGVVYFRLPAATPEQPANITLSVIDRGDLTLGGHVHGGRPRRHSSAASTVKRPAFTST